MDALDADFLPGHRAVGIHNPDALNVRLKGARGDLHHVHADPAFFLRQAPADNGGAGKLFLSANVANVTHFSVSYSKSLHGR